jgi:hypothetical protein
MRQLRPVVLDDVVLVEVPAAVASVEAVREVEHAGKLKSGPSWPETARRPARSSSRRNCAAVQP